MSFVVGIEITNFQKALPRSNMLLPSEVSELRAELAELKKSISNLESEILSNPESSDRKVKNIRLNELQSQIKPLKEKLRLVQSIESERISSDAE